MIGWILVVFVSLLLATISVIRIAIYGGSLIKPNFKKALERINRNNTFGIMLMQHKWFLTSNIVAYYLILLGWMVIIGWIFLYLCRS